MKLDFIILGAQKCGTTALADLLKAHPGVSFSKKKEPHFFSKTKDWRRDMPMLEAQFEFGEGLIYGEASTSYSYYPGENLEIWNDLYEHNPELKFIYLVRHPVDRLVSHYMHFFVRGFIDQPLEEAIYHHPMLINAGRYYTQIRPYIERFGREQVLILDFETFVKDMQAGARQAAAWLGLDPALLPEKEELRKNASLNRIKRDKKYDRLLPLVKKVDNMLPTDLVKKAFDRLSTRHGRSFEEKPTLPPKLRRAVIELNRLDIEALEKLTGRSYAAWLV